MNYYIWSFEHKAWWKSDWHGYTENFKEAGIYDFKTAMEVCRNANSHGRINEALVPVYENKKYG